MKDVFFILSQILGLLGIIGFFLLPFLFYMFL